MEQIPADVLARIRGEARSPLNRTKDFASEVALALGDLMTGAGPAERLSGRGPSREQQMLQEYQKAMDARFAAERQSGQRRPLQQAAMLELLDQLSPSNPITRDEMFPLIGGR